MPALPRPLVVSTTTATPSPTYSYRQDGNPFQVPGDKRYGGTNYMVGGEGSPNEWNGSSALAINFFDSRTRYDQPVWAPLGLAATTGGVNPANDNAIRFAVAQMFGINPNNFRAGLTSKTRTSPSRLTWFSQAWHRADLHSGAAGR